MPYLSSVSTHSQGSWVAGTADPDRLASHHLTVASAGTRASEVNVAVYSIAFFQPEAGAQLDEFLDLGASYGEYTNEVLLFHGLSATDRLQFVCPHRQFSWPSNTDSKNIAVLSSGQVCCSFCKSMLPSTTSRYPLLVLYARVQAGSLQAKALIPKEPPRYSDSVIGTLCLSHRGFMPGRVVTIMRPPTLHPPTTPG